MLPTWLYLKSLWEKHIKQYIGFHSNFKFGFCKSHKQSQHVTFGKCRHNTRVMWNILFVLFYAVLLFVPRENFILSPIEEQNNTRVNKWENFHFWWTILLKCRILQLKTQADSKYEWLSLLQFNFEALAKDTLSGFVFGIFWNFTFFNFVQENLNSNKCKIVMAKHTQKKKNFPSTPQ